MKQIIFVLLLMLIQFVNLLSNESIVKTIKEERNDLYATINLKKDVDNDLCAIINMIKSASIARGDQNKMIFQIHIYEGSVLVKKQSFWKRQKRIGIGTGALTFGAGVLFNYFGNNAYKDYKSAKSTSSADNARKNTKIYYSIRDISYSISIISLIYGAYSFYKELNFRNRRKTP